MGGGGDDDEKEKWTSLRLPWLIKVELFIPFLMIPIRFFITSHHESSISSLTESRIFRSDRITHDDDDDNDENKEQKKRGKLISNDYWISRRRGRDKMKRESQICIYFSLLLMIFQLTAVSSQLEENESDRRRRNKLTVSQSVSQCHPPPLLFFSFLITSFWWLTAFSSFLILAWCSLIHTLYPQSSFSSSTKPSSIIIIILVMRKEEISSHSYSIILFYSQISFSPSFFH